jgi:hypothetical protein
LGGSFRALNIEFFPIPKNEEVVSHPVRATEDPFVVKVVFVLNRICLAQNFILAKH